MNGSVSRSFMSLQSDIYLKSTRAFTVAQLMLVVGRWPQLLATQASLQDCLNILKVWQLASLRESDLKGQEESHNIFYDLDLEIIFYFFCNI